MTNGQHINNNRRLIKIQSAYFVYVRAGGGGRSGRGADDGHTKYDENNNIGHSYSYGFSPFQGRKNLSADNTPCGT